MRACAHCFQALEAARKAAEKAREEAHRKHAAQVGTRVKIEMSGSAASQAIRLIDVWLITTGR